MCSFFPLLIKECLSRQRREGLRGRYHFLYSSNTPPPTKVGYSPQGENFAYQSPTNSFHEGGGEPRMKCGINSVRLWVFFPHKNNSPGRNLIRINSEKKQMLLLVLIGRNILKVLDRSLKSLQDRKEMRCYIRLESSPRRINSVRLLSEPAMSFRRKRGSNHQTSFDYFLLIKRGKLSDKIIC